MKRIGNLWEQVVSKENIELAYEMAKKHKSNQRQVQKVEKHREEKLEEIRQMLINKTYKVSEYRIKKIYEPKEREIYVLPFYPDRIVQHALMNILAPIWDKKFIYDSYSCRIGKGQHRASNRCEQFVVRNQYVLQCDISKFYPSINHDILMKIIERKIKDKNVLWLLEQIIRSIDGDKNVPIGNYTSQWFGNLYLNELDTLIKQKYHIKDYIRYCDDFLLFANDKKLLYNIGVQIKEYCNNVLKLRLSKLRLFQTKESVDFLGYRHMKDHYILLRKSTAKRFKKHIEKLKIKLLCGQIGLENARSIVDSILGWLHYADTYNLIKSIGLLELRGYIMKGLPKTLNSKEDYIFAYNNYDKEYYVPLFQALLDSRYDWFMEKELENKEDGIEDDTHKIVEQDDMGETKYYQFVWKENKNCKLKKLGFTVKEIREMIK